MMGGYTRINNLFGSTFCGVVMRQYWNDLALWELFLNEFDDIKTVIELGSFHGGMTLFFEAQTRAREQLFISLDRDWPVGLDTSLARELRLPGRFIRGDYWTETNDALVSMLQKRSYKPTLLYVDGGNKPKEFKVLVPLLSAGDYVSVHDYSTEFKLEHAKPVEHLLERVFWEECERPPTPTLTRYWRRV